MHLEIFSDTICPWCYIGKRRFEAALAQFEHRDDVEVVWRSFELDPGAPTRHAGPQNERLAAKYGISMAQVAAMNARLIGEASKEGLDFHLEATKGGNTFDAHRLLHFAAESGRAGALKERLMKGYFTDGVEVGDADALARVAAEVGIDESEARAVLASDRFGDAVRADEARARAFGISGVPFFAIDERYGVSGAQPAESLLEALRQAHDDARLVTVHGDGEAGQCDDGSCAI